MSQPRLDNAQLADRLEEIARRFELCDETVFRIRAFQRAAEVLASHHEPMSRLADEGRLTEVPGIGASIARDIEQLLERGTCDVLEALREKMPPGLLDLFAVQGLGPKRIRALWQELDIDSLASLSEAVEDGRVSTLRGFGKKTQDNIRKELERIARMAGRTLRAQALPQALALRDHLAARQDVARVEVAGSLRRLAETVGDLDLVATSAHDPQPIMDAFISHPEVADVIAHGPSKSSARLRSGIQADLRVVRPDRFGSALHHFTGSYQHHIQLRARARTMGLKVNEYGVFREDDAADAAPLASAREEDVYAALKLPFIPPELREGRGEIEAAERGTLPTLITREDLRGDLHMHTTETDGADTIEAMALAARERGYRYICITDHSQAVTVANGMDAARARAHAERIREVDARVDGVRVLAGVEVDILRDGALDLPLDLLATLDFVIGSVHSSFALDEATMTARVVRAIESGRLHAVGHPTGRLLGSRDPYAIDMDAVIEAALTHGVALEINASPTRLDLNDILARRAREAGVRLIISSDAHATHGLDVIEHGVAVARRAWIEPGHVLNTLDADDLLEAVRRPA